MFSCLRLNSVVSPARCSLNLAIGLLLLAPNISLAAKIDIPVEFDANYITRILQQTLFQDNAEVSVWGDESGCTDLTLSNPEALIENGQFYVITDASAQSGVQLGSRCIGLLRWNGKIKAKQQANITDPRGRIAFSTIDTELLNPEGKSNPLSNRFWNLAKPSVHPYLDQLRIDLIGAVDELRQLLPLFVSGQDLQSSRKMIDSVHLDHLTVTDQNVAAMVEFDIEIQQTEVKPVAQSALTEEETNQFLENWQQWDRFLVFIVKTAARDILVADEKDQLLDVLIQTRYDLVDVLQTGNVRSAEALRQSFVTTWQLLRPVFRHLSENLTGSKSLRLLSFITAADALETLGDLERVIGWNISVDGLRQLARILIEDQSVDPLSEAPDSDGEMRELFEFDRSLQLPQPNFGEITPKRKSLRSRFLAELFMLVPAANANTHSEMPSEDVPLDLNNTSPNRENLEVYLTQVQGLLNSVTYGTLMTKPLDSTYRKLFSHLVLTTAWQETCWRQYQSRNGELSTMTSSAGALGMMQIMPLVWKGFYDSTALAEDIEYNAAAGTEILHRYLIRYAIRKGEDKHEGGIENLARASYAAYNGGPKHLSRYRKSGTSDSLKKIDESFWQKYQQVRDGNQLAVKQCYPYF